MSCAAPEIAPQIAAPADRCLLHPPPRENRPWTRSDPGYRTCASCLDHTRERLTEIGQRWAALNPRPGASGQHGSRGAPGFGSRPPAVDVVIVLRDWRSARTARVWLGADGRVHQESERPPLSVPSELFALAYHVAEARRMSLPVPSVPELVRWLDGQLDWVTRQEGVVVFDRVLRELVTQLRPLTGEPRPKFIGKCPNVLQLDGAEGEHTRECGRPLYAPFRGDTISCSCGARWPREKWLRLGQVLQAAA